MRPLPRLPQTEVTTLAAWSNFHHAISGRPMAAYLTPGGRGLPVGARRGSALSADLAAILGRCMADPPERLCTVGARWSLSSILDPGELILDAGAWNQVAAVSPRWM